MGDEDDEPSGTLEVDSEAVKKAIDAPDETDAATEPEATPESETATPESKTAEEVFDAKAKFGELSQHLEAQKQAFQNLPYMIQQEIARAVAGLAPKQQEATKPAVPTLPEIGFDPNDPVEAKLAKLYEGMRGMDSYRSQQLAEVQQMLARHKQEIQERETMAEADRLNGRIMDAVTKSGISDKDTAENMRLRVLALMQSGMDERAATKHAVDWYTNLKASIINDHIKTKTKTNGAAPPVKGASHGTAAVTGQRKASFDDPGFRKMVMAEMAAMEEASK
jgi:hypothetical protein